MNYNGLKIVHRERNVFPALRSPDGLEPSYYDVPEGVIVLGNEQVN